ncbi:MAG: NAD(P)H-binding protein, partial [Acidimicrobiia bacterium]|nr:NAD(P)H-binding protein [Acidimicrobiia bacterium]
MARILVTGATGYIGGRLIPQLLEAGHDVRCMTRSPSRLSLDPWRDRVEVVAGDILDIESLEKALSDCDAAYYLVHSMGNADDFAEADRQGATNFQRAADSQGLGKIIYLGGLGEDDTELSSHLDSRHEVGRLLAAGDTPVTELRAAVIIGSGSVSFEMLRYLTEVLPAMTTPKWVRSLCQPIAIRDVLTILVAVAGEDGSESKIVEIGGPDVLSYQDMMQTYAQVAGLRKRLIVPVPVLSPGLSSLWIGLVTP